MYSTEYDYVSTAREACSGEGAKIPGWRQLNQLRWDIYCVAVEESTAP